MNGLNSRKEILIAELLGEVDTLLTEVGKLVPAIASVSAQLISSANGTKAAVEDYQVKTRAVANQAQISAVDHIIRRTNEVALKSLEEQTQAMKEAARTLFDKEVASRLRELSAVLNAALEKARAPNWINWLTHATTALVSAAATAALLLHVLRP